MKKLTIMCSIYKAGDWIENRLQNLINSTRLQDFEIWVVNANSPDQRDHDIPQKFQVKYVKLPERIGVYKAWNYIINNSDSDYVTNANADDLIAPQGYEKLISSLDFSNYYDFVYPSWYSTSTPNMKWSEVKESGLASVDGIPGEYCGDLTTAGVGHFPVWRRSLHKRLGMFDENFKALGDADWWARCYFKGRCKFKWLNKPLACYLWRGHTDHPNLWAAEINQNEWDLYHTKLQQYKSQ